MTDADARSGERIELQHRTGDRAGDDAALVTHTMVDRAVAADQMAWEAEGSTPHVAMRAALAAVAPDIAAAERARCAAEIPAGLRLCHRPWHDPEGWRCGHCDGCLTDRLAEKWEAR